MNVKFTSMLENYYRKQTASKNGHKQIYFRDRPTDNILLLEVRGEVSAVRCNVLQYTVLDIALKLGSEWHTV
jgi:hypothetical protein